MAVTLKQGFGLVPNGAAISAANTNDTGDRPLDAVTIGSGATLAGDTSQLLHGKPMVKYQTGVSAAANAGWNSTSFTNTSKFCYATFYIYIGALGTNITSFRVTSGGTSNVVGSFFILTSRLIRWTSGSSGATLVTTTTPIPLNTLCRVEAGIFSDSVAGWAELKTYFTDPESSTPDESLRSPNSNVSTFTPNTIRFGATNAAASNGPVWFGGITVSDTAYAGGVASAPIPTSGDMVSGSAFGGAGIRSTPITATLVSGSALASTAPDRATPVAADMVSGSSFGGATPPVTVTEAAVMTSGSAMAGTTPTLVEQAAATMVSGSVVTGSNARITPLASTAMASGSQLLGAGAVSGKPTGAFTSGSKLLNTAGMTLKIVSAGAMVSGSALDGGSPARIQGAIAGMLSGSVMTGGASLVIAPIAAFSSGSAFGSASAATTSVTAVLLSGSLFGGSGLRTSPATAVLVSASAFSPSGALKTSAVGLMVSSTLFTGGGFVSSFSTMVSGSTLLTPIVEAGLKVVEQGILHDAVEADVIINKQKHVAKVWVIRGGRKRPVLDTQTNLIANSGSKLAILSSEGGGTGTSVRQNERTRFSPWSTRFTWTSGARGISLSNGFLPLAPGTYSLSWWVFVESGSMPAWIATSNVYGRPRQLGGPTAQGVWQECKATFDVTAAEGGVRIYSTISSASQYVVDGIMLVEGPTPQPFADGDFPGWQWKGTPGNSASVGFPYLLQNIVGAPIAEVTGVGTKLLTQTEMPPFAARTTYVVTDRFAVLTVGSIFFAHMAPDKQVGTDVQTAYLRQDNGGVYTFRPQFPGGGGAGGTYGINTANVKPAAGTRNVLAVSLSEGLDTAEIDINGVTTAQRTGMDVGTGLSMAAGIYTVIGSSGGTVYDTPVYAVQFRGEHSRELRTRVAAWLARRYSTRTASNIFTNPNMILNSNGWTIVSGGTGVGTTTRARQATGGPANVSSVFERLTFTAPFTPPAAADILALNVGALGGATIGVSCAVSPGMTYTQSIWVRSSIAQKLSFQAQYIRGGSGASVAPRAPDVTLVPNTWTRLVLTSVAPSDAQALRVDIDAAVTAPLPWSIGDTFDYTGAMINEDGLLDYADGNSQGWKWDGTVNASTSRPASIVPAGY